MMTLTIDDYLNMQHVFLTSQMAFNHFSRKCDFATFLREDELSTRLS
jgi:hypothetical protein